MSSLAYKSLQFASNAVIFFGAEKFRPSFSALTQKLKKEYESMLV